MELLRLIWLLVISHLLLGDIVYAKSESVPANPSKVIFDQTIQAEFEILNYIKKESANLKWQDVYNVLIAMSAYTDITKEYLQENSLMSAQQAKRISELYWIANVIFQNALERFPSEFRSLFSEEVSFSVVARFINSTAKSHSTSWPTPANAFPMNMSDICITNTLSGSINSASCNVSELCWKYISQPGTRMEAAISQLYTDYLIRQVDYCGFKLVKLAGSIAHLVNVEEDLCSRIYLDFKKILYHNISDIHKAELILQQITLCGGMFGYVEFSALYPVHEVFKYKAKNGCFRDTSTNRRSEKIPLSPSLELVNSRDDGTSGNCNLHVTTVALGSLATSLRWWSFKHLGLHRTTEAPKSNNGLVYAFVIVCLLLVAVIGGIAAFIIYPRFKKRKYDEL